jgi:hypothetical protein
VSRSEGDQRGGHAGGHHSHKSVLPKGWRRLMSKRQRMELKQRDRIGRDGAERHRHRAKWDFG